MPDTNPMPALLRRLEAIGFEEDFVRSAALPEWWDDEIALNPAGYAEGLMFISRGLNLDLRSLDDPSRRIETRKPKPVAGGPT